MKHELVTSQLDPQMKVVVLVGGLAIQFDDLENAQTWADQYHPKALAIVHEENFYPQDSMATIFIAARKMH